MSGSNMIRIESTYYIKYFDRRYEVINDGISYSNVLKGNGAKAVIATKCGCVIAKPLASGEHINTYSQSGILESQSVAKENSFVVTKADENGNPIVDENGNTNSWIIGEDVLRRRYELPDEGLDKEVFLKPSVIEQEFVQVDRNIAFMKPWGENGKTVPQLIDAGGYMNITDPNDIYGISERDFEDTYRVLRVIVTDESVINQ